MSKRRFLKKSFVSILDCVVWKNVINQSTHTHTHTHTHTRARARARARYRAILAS